MENEELKNLPKPHADLPKTLSDLPLPEKEITAHASEPSSSSRKGFSILRSFLLGFLLVVLIVLIGGGSFMLGTKHSNSKNQQIVETKITSPSPTVNPKANWKTFEGKGFSFMYPGNLFIRDDSKTSSGLVQFLTDPKSASSILNLSVSPNPKNLDLLILAKKTPIPYDRTNDKYEKTTINTYEAVKTTSDLPCVGDCEKDEIEEKGYSVLIKGDKVIISFDVSTFSKSGYPTATKEWLDQILSTFKFTDASMNITPTCRPRPSCLDSNPRCMMAETSDMCPPPKPTN